MVVLNSRPRLPEPSSSGKRACTIQRLLRRENDQPAIQTDLGDDGRRRLAEEFRRTRGRPLHGDDRLEPTR